MGVGNWDIEHPTGDQTAFSIFKVHNLDLLWGKGLGKQVTVTIFDHIVCYTNE